MVLTSHLSNCPLQSVPVLFVGRCKPNSDGGAGDRLDDGSVKGDQQLLRQVKRPELSQKAQPLLSLLMERDYVGGPLQGPRDCGSQEPKGVNGGNSIVGD